MRWQTINDSALQVRSWNDEFVVYNPHSGDTHILNAQGADILLTLQAAASDVLSLAQLLASKWQCEMNAEFLEELETVLSDMQALSLVERV